MWNNKMINQQTTLIYGLLGKHMFMFPNSNIVAHMGHLDTNITDKERFVNVNNMVNIGG